MMIGKFACALCDGKEYEDTAIGHVTKFHPKIAAITIDLLKEALTNFPQPPRAA